ncbi:MAG: DNA polymerase III subunit gamma/tau [Phycisphaerales bacterium]
MAGGSTDKSEVTGAAAEAAAPSSSKKSSSKESSSKKSSTKKTTSKKTTKKTTTKKETSIAKQAGSADSSRGYTVLARRYRSRDFGEVVGQEPIARTLQRAIEQGRTAHAYLFCGTRGVGKTSMARIFAKALNLHDADGNPLSEAGAIEASILRGEDLDVIEIDGASNRGINEARDLIAGAGLSPTRGRFKIYIIDEVHMLTREAFNALLKTMEEPPPHVKFILCTTDPQKVPATIQSRCQRFDFKAIATSRIAEHLREILAAEDIQAESDVVQTVASLGNGSMRDALSLLDRLLAGGGQQLTMAEARDVLGLPDAELLDRIIAAVIDSDPASGLAAGAELIGGGATVEAALEMLTERLRTLMVISACGAETDLLDLTDEARSRGAEQAAHFDAAGLVYMIATCDAVARNARGSATGRALFDAALVRLTLGQRFGEVPAMLAGGGDEKKKQRTAEPRLSGSGPRAASAVAVVAPAQAPKPAPVSAPGPKSAPASAPAPAPAPAPAASAPAPSPKSTSASVPAAGDLHAAWRQLEAETGGALQSVIAALRPREIEGERTVVLEPRKAGERAGFLARRAERLAEPLGLLLGRTVQLRIDDSGSSSADRSGGSSHGPASGAAVASDHSGGAAHRGPAHSGSATAGIAVGGAAAGSAPNLGAEGRTSADRQDASELPLVREAMQIFDAMVTDVAVAPVAAPAPDAGADPGPDPAPPSA